MGPDPDLTLSRTSACIDSMLGDGVIILHLKTGVFYGLEQAGARVWDLLQRAQTLRSLSATIQDEFDVEPGQCLDELTELVVQMEKRELVQVGDAGPI